MNSISARDAVSDAVPDVIIADNEAMIRTVLRAMFSSIGQNVWMAANGEEVVGFASATPAKLVLLDLRMPRLDGLQTCEKLRAMPAYAQTPIGILTMSDDAGTERDAIQAGATLFLRKPFQPAVLLETLAPYLGIDAATHDTVTQAARRARQIAGP